MPSYADRVREGSSTTGTGAFSLSGAATAGFQAFVTAFADNVTFGYCITNGTTEWEVGFGYLTGSGSSLVRSTVATSSNSNALVNFSAGTKDVFCTEPAVDLINDGLAFAVSRNLFMP